MKINEKIKEALYNIISESKQEMYDRIAENRTRHITVALENIQKEHNASAIIRNCDCFGIQDLHVIEKGVKYNPQREISKGAGNWIDVYSYDSDNAISDCITHLRSKGYKIVATSPHATQSIHNIDIAEPIALFFGTERQGISPEVEENADELISIPMVGFTESLNVSVSVAIAVSTLRSRLEESTINWKLPQEEQTELIIEWCAKIINRGEKVVEEIKNRIQSDLTSY